MQKDGRNYIIRADSLPPLTELADKKSLSETIWNLPSLARKTSALMKENASLSFLPTYVSTRRVEKNGASASRRRRPAP
jgi:hypothetical protein